jgi:hypothetical protein
MTLQHVHTFNMFVYCSGTGTGAADADCVAVGGYFLVA